MSAGRPPKGVSHVDRVSGCAQGKERLRVMLETITGEVSLVEACARLGLSETCFVKLRQRALEAAAHALERGRPGRPAKEVSPDAQRVVELEAEVKSLRQRLVKEEARIELALVVPEMVKRGRDPEIKKKRRREKKRNKPSQE